MRHGKHKQLQIREKTLMDGFFVKHVLRFLFKGLFKLTGWTSGPAPKITGVVIGAPHTSNWDFLFGIGAAIIEDMKVYFSIKQSWCQLPVIGAGIMWLGAIPIDRSVAGLGQAEQISRFVNNKKDQCIYFAFTPEGTRGKVKNWKTGFYHVAQDCGLPLHLAKLDYENKNAGVFHSFKITGNKNDDIQVLQAAYKLVRGHDTTKQFPEYSGTRPTVNNLEAQWMKALYLAGGNLTQTRAAAWAASLPPLNTTPADSIMASLIQLGLAEKSENGSTAPVYSLTLLGKGLLLHKFAVLE